MPASVEDLVTRLEGLREVSGWSPVLKKRYLAGGSLAGQAILKVIAVSSDPETAHFSIAGIPSGDKVRRPGRMRFEGRGFHDVFLTFHDVNVEQIVARGQLEMRPHQDKYLIRNNFARVAQG
jgi:hypothetical protein